MIGNRCRASARLLESRVRDVGDAFRVIYIANLADAVYVLHAFQKKTQQTAQRDLVTALRRLRQITRNPGQ
jgi:phage-related protein